MLETVNTPTDGMERHIKQVNQVEYSCGLCGKIFKDKYKLGRHQKTHTGVKDEVCPYCQKAFNRKDHMKVHIWNKHGLHMKKSYNNE